MYVQYLAQKNLHPRDKCITFDEEPHIYTINGDSEFTSVTTWNHSHFDKFDSDKIINNMMKSHKWSQHKLFGKTKEEILQIWDTNKVNSANAGTKLHYDIECYYNEQPSNNSSLEYSYFLNFQQDFNNLTPYRTEWMVYDEELRMAGSIDMIYKKDDGHLLIYDWKRCKDISKFSRFNKFSNNPIICDFPDTNFWHYSLQLNTYKAILERCYGEIVDDLYLVCLHPDNKSKNYERIKVPNLQNQVKELFDERIKNL
jgi:ATP-dependent exoDNAse (exonuclease V) beta subunit